MYRYMYYISLGPIYIAEEAVALMLSHTTLLQSHNVEAICHRGEYESTLEFLDTHHYFVRQDKKKLKLDHKKREVFLQTFYPAGYCNILSVLMYVTKYQSSQENMYTFVSPSLNSKCYFHCKVCNKDVSEVKGMQKVKLTNKGYMWRP